MQEKMDSLPEKARLLRKKVLSRRVQHVFDEDSISGGGIIYQHKGKGVLPTKGPL